MPVFLSPLGADTASFISLHINTNVDVFLGALFAREAPYYVPLCPHRDSMIYAHTYMYMFVCVFVCFGTQCQNSALAKKSRHSDHLSF